MSERGPALRSVAAEWWQKPVLPEEDPPEGEPLALREGWSGETRDQRLSSLATGVHLAPGDLTHSKPLHSACRRHADHRATGSFAYRPAAHVAERRAPSGFSTSRNLLVDRAPCARFR